MVVLRQGNSALPGRSCVTRPLQVSEKRKYVEMNGAVHNYATLSLHSLYIGGP